MALPTSKQKNEFTPIEPDNYEVGFKRLVLTTEKEFQTEAFNNGEGLRFQAAEFTWDVDGEEWTERFVKVSTNENAKFYNRITAVFGRKLTEEDVIAWGVNDAAQKNLPLDDYYKAPEDDPENDIKKGQWVHKGESFTGIEGPVDSLTINGEELIGKRCLLQIDVNDKGYNRAKAQAAAPLPKRSKPQPAQAPAGAPT